MSPRVSHSDKQRLLALLTQGLQAIGALPETPTAQHRRAWRALIQRADLTPEELRLLENAARRMARRRDGARGDSPAGA